MNLRTSPTLVVDRLAVEYKRPALRAVDGVSLKVSADEVVALVGESGCGKSSLARAIVGIEARASGTVRLLEEELRPLGLRRRKPKEAHVQMVFQDPSTSLNPRRTVGDQIADGVTLAERRGLKSSSVETWMRRVELDPNKAGSYPHEFSGGEKQRLAVARALAARPTLLVADEPISALDASTQVSVASLMRSLCQDENAAMLFISHDLSVVHRIADRMCIMYQGRFVETGATAEVWGNPIHPYTRSLLGAIPPADGRGTLPLVPGEAERRSWSQEIPEALRGEPTDIRESTALEKVKGTP